MESAELLRIRESFIHLKGLNAFINLETIERVEYNLDFDDYEEGSITRFEIYTKSMDEPIIASDIVDIAALAYFFFDLEPKPNDVIQEKS